MFMSSKNSGAADPYTLFLNVTLKIALKRSNRYVTSSSLSIYYTWKNIKKLYKINKFKVSAATRSEEFELFYGS